VAIERFYKYNWQGLLESKAEVFGHSAGNEVAVSGEWFRTTYDLYDRLGNLRAMHYPSGVLVTYGYGEGGAMTGVEVGGHRLFDGIEYAAHGAAARMDLYDPTNPMQNPGVNWVQTFNDSSVKNLSHISSSILQPDA
jgi:hypothetical protein